MPQNADISATTSPCIPGEQPQFSECSWEDVKRCTFQASNFEEVLEVDGGPCTYSDWLTLLYCHQSGRQLPFSCFYTNDWLVIREIVITGWGQSGKHEQPRILFNVLFLSQPNDIWLWFRFSTHRFDILWLGDYAVTNQARQRCVECK